MTITGGTACALLQSLGHWLVHLRLDPTWALVAVTCLALRLQTMALRNELRVKTLLRYEDKWDQLLRPRAELAMTLLLRPGAPIDYDVPNFFESLAQMLQLGYVPPDTVWSFFDNSARFYWWALEDHGYLSAGRQGDDQCWKGFDKLVERLAKIQRKRDRKDRGRPTRDEIREFLQREATPLIPRVDGPANRAIGTLAPAKRRIGGRSGR